MDRIPSIYKIVPTLYDSYSCEIIVLITKDGNDWIIASEKNMWARNGVGEIPVSHITLSPQSKRLDREDLPLYLGWPVITPKFAELLKGLTDEKRTMPSIHREP